jgi:hypothetical protein
MAKIVCPNKQYNGISASVSFINGIGETYKTHLIDWFREHGYRIEDEKQDNGEGGEGDIDGMTVKELKAYAEGKKIDLGEAKTKAEMIAVIAKPESEGGENKGDGDGDNGEGGEGNNE